MAQEERRWFVKHSFFKVSKTWRRLPQGEREHSKNQFVEMVTKFSDQMAIASYSLVGTRGDVDFMLWKVCQTLEPINELLAQINCTELAGYLEMPHSYLSMTRKSPYVDDHQHQLQESPTTGIRILGRKYLFLYPFIKTHEWYQLPKDQRQQLMNEHFMIGHRYPEIKISTAYSFGLDDQEFVLGFESDEASTFLDLVEELRYSKVRPYTLQDTPIFTCVNKPMNACLNDLG